MSLAPMIRESLRLPLVCAPMFLVTTADMVAAACTSGIMGVLPRGNFRSTEAFEAALIRIADIVARHRDVHPEAVVGPLAVNLAARGPEPETTETLALCKRHGVKLLITALGGPAEMVKRATEWGAIVYHDVISLKFAEKAIAAGVAGLVAVSWGGGGHSGTVSPLVLIPEIRRIFDGTIILGGAVATGAAIRAAEILGADLTYMGTRFIATREAGTAQRYKRMLVEGTDESILYSARVNGAPASWLRPSLTDAGLDPDDLPIAGGFHDYGHLPAGVTPWRDLWSAGQGVALIDDVPPLADLVERLARDYAEACAIPMFEGHHQVHRRS
ncbi:NAD(P)H-dependent flavin oxidoreductase [Sphingomonas sp. YL-JM2C]